jgi:DNA repair protein RadC
MISLEDMIGMSGLSEEEILAIAEHEHMPPSVASNLGAYLASSHQGLGRVRDMIFEDIRAAQASGNVTHERELLHVLHHFLRLHPDERPAEHPWSSVY